MLPELPATALSMLSLGSCIHAYNKQDAIPEIHHFSGNAISPLNVGCDGRHWACWTWCDRASGCKWPCWPSRTDGADGCTRDAWHGSRIWSEYLVRIADGEYWQLLLADCWNGQFFQFVCERGACQFDRLNRPNRCVRQPGITGWNRPNRCVRQPGITGWNRPNRCVRQPGITGWNRPTGASGSQGLQGGTGPTGASGSQGSQVEPAQQVRPAARDYRVERVPRAR